MFCPNCGALNEDTAHFCGICGSKMYTEEPVCQRTVYQQPAVQQSYYQVQNWPVNSSYQPPAVSKIPGRGLGIAGLILGIVAVVFGMVWVLSAICGALAVIFSVVALRKADKVGQGNGMATAGLVCGLIGLALAVLFGVVGLDLFSIPADAGMDYSAYL